MAQQEHIVIMNCIMRSVNNLKQAMTLPNSNKIILYGISSRRLYHGSNQAQTVSPQSRQCWTTQKFQNGLDQMHVINDFPTDYKSCSTFNIENLAAYKGLAITPYDTSHLLSHDPITNPMTQPAPPNISPTCKEFWMSSLFVSTRKWRSSVQPNSLEGTMRVKLY